MPFTSTDLVAIDAAIASGAKVVRFSDGRSTEYRSIDELERARSMVVNEIAKAAGAPRVRQVRITTRDGWA